MPSGTNFEVDTPKVLFDAPHRIQPTRQYDVTSDGQKFLLNFSADEEVSIPMTLVQNWREGEIQE